MKLTKAILKAMRINNPHNLCTVGCGKVFVIYRPQMTGRAHQNAAWQVIRPGYKTDSQGSWRDNGHKTFNVWAKGNSTHNEVKEQQRLAAIAWSTEKYGITEWVRDPFGDYQEKTTIDRVVAMVKSKAATERVTSKAHSLSKPNKNRNEHGYSQSNRKTAE